MLAIDIHAQRHGALPGPIAEVHRARLLQGRCGVGPGAEEQPLTGAGLLGGALLADAVEIANRAIEEDVVPAGNAQGRDVDVVVPLLDAARRPELIPCGMGEPLQEVG